MGSRTGNCDETPSGTKAATFHYTAAVQKELLNFVATIDTKAVVTELQE